MNLDLLQINISDRKIQVSNDNLQAVGIKKQFIGPYYNRDLDFRPNMNPTNRLYEEVLTGSYLNSRHRKLSRPDTSQGSAEDEGPNTLTPTPSDSYIAHFRPNDLSPVVPCSETFCEENTCDNNNQAEPRLYESIEPEDKVIFRPNQCEQLCPGACNKPSVLKVPCGTIKEYREGDKSNLQMYAPQADHDLNIGSIDKERKDVEDAIERYTQARIYASFESFLQDRKPCYVEKCGFNRSAGAVSPGLMSNVCGSSVDEVFRESVDSGSAYRMNDWESLLVDDVSDEVYDKLHESSSPESYCRSINSRMSCRPREDVSNSPSDASSSPCLGGYTGKIGYGFPRGPCLSHELSVGPVPVHCSNSLAPTYCSDTRTNWLGEHQNDDDEYDDDEDDDDCDDDDEIRDERTGNFPEIAEC